MNRFSQLYLERGKPAQDSKRARKRLASWFWEVRSSIRDSDSLAFNIAQRIRTELGVDVPGEYQTNVGGFLETCQVRDFLDAITIIHDVMLEDGFFQRYTDGLIGFVNRVFQEENLSYRADGNAVVHYRVDEEFSLNLTSAIAAVAAPKYAQVHAAFERARSGFEQAQPDVLGGLRNLFEASESLFKMITGSGKALDEGEVTKSLLPFIQRLHSATDPIAQRSTARLANGFGDWVQAIHPYRHGHDAPEPVVPPMAFAIAAMSTGAAYIRWLAALDQAP